MLIISYNRLLFKTAFWVIMCPEELILVLEEKRKRRTKAIRLATAVNMVEGVSITAGARQLSSSWASGEISGKAMKTALIKKHRRPEVVANNERSISI
jgi:hypothetical protein